MGAQLIAPLKSERGTTLIETVIATALLLVVMVGLLSMAALATIYTENHGHLEARTTEYAQDKMEQLLALAYTDAVSNTVVVSGGADRRHRAGRRRQHRTRPRRSTATSTGWRRTASLLGGGTTPPANWFYERVWQITQP